MTNPHSLFIRELDEFIADTAYAQNTVSTARLNDFDALKRVAIKAGSFTGESLEKFKFVLTQRFGVRDSQVDGEVKNVRVKMALGEYPCDIKDYIRLFMESQKLEYRIIGDYQTAHGEEIPSNSVVNRLLGLDADLKLYGDSRLRAALSNYGFDAHRQAFTNILDTIRYDGVGSDAPH